MNVYDVADRLLTAHRTGEPTHPVIEDHPDATLSDAYRVQLAQVERWTAEGGIVKGYKVGLSSAAAQQQFGVDHPNFGHLLADFFHGEEQPIPTDRLLQPRIEPEIAFVLGRSLSGPGVTVADAIRAVEFALPALEIVDSRIRDWKVSVVDLVADNGVSAGVVLGGRPTTLSNVDVRAVRCTLYSHEHALDSGSSTAVLGSPLNALVWLANTLGARGLALQEGHVVLTGTMTRAFPVGAGDRVVATMSGLGSVTAVFAP